MLNPRPDARIGGGMVRRRLLNILTKNKQSLPVISYCPFYANRLTARGGGTLCTVPLSEEGKTYHVQADFTINVATVSNRGNTYIMFNYGSVRNVADGSINVRPYRVYDIGVGIYHAIIDVTVVSMSNNGFRLNLDTEYAEMTVTLNSISEIGRAHV